MARKAYALTNDPKYLNMPIFVPKGLSDEEYKILLAKGNEALTTGDREIFFEAMEGLEDITAGNPNLQFQQGFGTGYDDWYKTPSLRATGGDDRSGRRRGYGYGYGYGGSGYAAGMPYIPGAQEGIGYSEPAFATDPMQAWMVGVNAPQYAARGGIMNLRR